MMRTSGHRGVRLERHHAQIAKLLGNGGRPFPAACPAVPQAWGRQSDQVHVVAAAERTCP
jgi:hypothetical protein